MFQIASLKLIGDLDPKAKSYLNNPAEHAEAISRIKLMYITPEKVTESGQTREFLRYLNERNLIRRIIVDECHCIVNWGQTFRKAFVQVLQVLTVQLDMQVPWSFYTATIHHCDVQFISTQMTNGLPVVTYNGRTIQKKYK